MKKLLPTILGLISLLADLMTLGQFILNDIAFDFWSSRWFISIFLILLLLFLGGSLLFMANAGELGSHIIAIFGGVYLFLSMALYSIFGYLQITAAVSWQDYFGYLMLFGISSFTGVCSLALSKNYSTIEKTAYGFAAVNLVIIFFMVNKYVLQAYPFKFASFCGEVFIVLLGSAYFLGLYFASKWLYYFIPSSRNRRAIVRFHEG